jgi:hypothetical protein
MNKITGSCKFLKARMILLLFAFSGIILLNCSGPAENNRSDLESGFQNPPESARPRVWWHWMNGNVSKEGIRADLEWMHRTGIGGFQNFDAGLASPQIVKKRLIYMTPEWKDAFLFTTKLADSLGLEMAIAGSPGWSESGGPWVPPSQAMKKLVWSETQAEGGNLFKGILPKPPATTGRFQNIPGPGGFSISTKTLPEYYADAAVIAYRLPPNDLSIRELNPKITSGTGKIDPVLLSDGNLDNSVFLPAAKVGEKTWIQYEFSKPVTISSLSLATRDAGISFAGFGGQEYQKALEASDDGSLYRTILEIPSTDLPQGTFTFPPSTAKYFRVTFKTPPPPPGRPDLAELFGDMIHGQKPQQAGIRVSEALLNTVARVNRFEDKAGFTSFAGIYDLATIPVPEQDAISPDSIINLSQEMHPDGSIEWTPPSGRWIILRLGCSLTGHQNSPASPEATGLEVDKLNAGFVKAYFENYLDQYKDATGGMMGDRGLKYMITDSWEAGVQNWTDSMIYEFTKRRGYDLLRWLPALTGHIVESAEASDRFLWDFRKTIADLTAENHYDQLTSILKNRGMGRYTESHESGRALIADGMDVKRKADIPMSATWVPGGFSGDENAGVATGYKADVRESASVAHIYGQNLVAAESMTAIGNAWAYSPERLKPTADMELANGLNRFVIHTSVHQPVSDKIPGLGLGPFGQWFTRHETWAEYAGPWVTYLARNSFMLQQGKFVADIVYYYGEDNNITALFGEKLPDIPEGYNYDFVNSDALINQLSVDRGMIVTPSGMRYHLLMLDKNSRHMPLAVLLKIRDLVNAGAVVAGPRPVDSPSLADDQVQFKAVVNLLWPPDNGVNIFGKGRIISGKSAGDVLKEINIAPDFKYKKTDDKTSLLFVHRNLPEADLFWVNNRNNRNEDIEASFRVKGREPEIWHPETGKIEPASFKIAEGRTTVPLHLVSNDAVFIVFRKSTGTTQRIIPRPEEKLVSQVSVPWSISFQPGRGAPSQITTDTLGSWSASSDPGVKYFSGTGTYTADLKASDNWFSKDTGLWLDLGDVKNLAQVLVNGKDLGIVWKKPFRVNVSEALKPGINKLEIRVTNLWVNRLIGDQQPGVRNKITYTTQAFYKADSPLLPSGLLGPVEILSITEKK